MSEELNEVKDEKKCKCSLLVSLVAVTMVFTIAIFVLLLVNTLRGGAGMPVGGPGGPGGPEGPGPEANAGGKAVVISTQYDKGQTLAKARAAKKPIVAFFYTDWCGFCQRFAPTFAKITKDRAIKDKFAVAYINCEKEENQSDMQAYEVQGFPTVYVIKEDGTKVQLENSTFFDDDSVKNVKERMLEIIAE